MKNARYKHTVRYSFALAPADAEVIEKELKHERNRSSWLRDAVMEYARTNAAASRRARRYRRGK